MLLLDVRLNAGCYESSFFHNNTHLFVFSFGIFELLKERVYAQVSCSCHGHALRQSRVGMAASNANLGAAGASTADIGSAWYHVAEPTCNCTQRYSAHRVCAVILCVNVLGYALYTESHCLDECGVWWLNWQSGSLQD